MRYNFIEQIYFSNAGIDKSMVDQQYFYRKILLTGEKCDM